MEILAKFYHKNTSFSDFVFRAGGVRGRQALVLANLQAEREAAWDRAA